MNGPLVFFNKLAHDAVRRVFRLKCLIVNLSVHIKILFSHSCVNQLKLSARTHARTARLIWVLVSFGLYITFILVSYVCTSVVSVEFAVEFAVSLPERTSVFFAVRLMTCFTDQAIIRFLCEPSL